jgi:hypothetical protein
MSNKRIVEVAGQRAQLLDERMPGYRADAVRAVIEILQLQGAGHSDKGRRERAGHVIEALADKVAAKKGQD